MGHPIFILSLAVSVGAGLGVELMVFEFTLRYCLPPLYCFRMNRVLFPNVSGTLMI